MSSPPTATTSPQGAEWGPPLSEQLLHSAQLIMAVMAGSSFHTALPKVPAALRAGVQALSMTTLRHTGLSLAVLGLLAPRKPKPLISALLQVALAHLLQDKTNYTPHTLVHQCVTAAQSTPTLQAQSRFINAILRRALRERSALLEQLSQPQHPAHLLASYNHPEWWVKQLQQDWPEQWAGILQAAQQTPPLSLRINARHMRPADYLPHLTALGIEAHITGPYGITLTPHRGMPGVTELPGYAQGWFSVQDLAAQMAAPLLLQACAQPPQRILDACAAPGGKTTHLLELCNAEVIALESDEGRSRRIHENLQRLNLHAQVKIADATQVDQFWEGQAFDAILLDAPCSASGINARHPDVRWLRRPTDLGQLAQLQSQILDALWPLLKPNGVMLYATCSVFATEGHLQTSAFLNRSPDALALPHPGHLLPHLDSQTPAHHDGFYYALLRKTA